MLSLSERMGHAHFAGLVVGWVKAANSNLDAPQRWAGSRNAFDSVKGTIHQAAGFDEFHVEAEDASEDDVFALTNSGEFTSGCRSDC